MLPADYIKNQPAERQEILTAIHNIISAHDKTIAAVVEPMMGKEMILYKMQQGKGMMKYGLASVKNHMSLHLLPMYMLPKIYNKYVLLLAQAKFQKGCINFNSGTEIPLPVVQQLIIDCAPVDLQKMRDGYEQSKKSAKKKVK